MHVTEDMQSFVLLKTKTKIKILEIVNSTEFVGKTFKDKPGDFSKSQFSMMCKKNKQKKNRNNKTLFQSVKEMAFDFLRVGTWVHLILNLTHTSKR